MDVHPGDMPSATAPKKKANGRSKQAKAGLSITFDKNATKPKTAPKSPTSPSLKSRFTLGYKKSQRPKSAQAPPPSKTHAKQKSRTLSLTSRDLRNVPAIVREPKLQRSPSTPSLRSSEKPFSPSAILPTIQDDPPQLPQIVPSITLSTEVLREPSSSSSSSSSAFSLSSEDSSNQPSTAATSPTTQSISSASTSSSSDAGNDAGSDEKDFDITTFLAAPRLTQRVRLKSGRVVSFSEVGNRDGFPVFVFLGMGCVRYFIAFFDDLASSYGLRLICPDRPGVGLSDDVKTNEQQVLKWPDVIEELCGLLSIEKFYIMAHSAGAPYALACALKIPHRLQGTIYLVCPWVSTTVANNFKWLRFVPTSIMKFTNTAGISLQQMMYGRQPYATKPSHRRSGALASPMTSLEKKQQLGLAILKASFAENLAGANNDLLMCFERRHPFGFSYTDVDHPVAVFHGTKDDRIPVSAVKWMEENMPNCKLTLIEGGKHSLFLRAEVVDTVFKSIAMQLHVKDECRVCKMSSRCWLTEEVETARSAEMERASRREDDQERHNSGRSRSLSSVSGTDKSGVNSGNSSTASSRRVSFVSSIIDSRLSPPILGTTGHKTKKPTPRKSAPERPLGRKRSAPNRLSRRTLSASDGEDAPKIDDRPVAVYSFI